MNPAGPGTNTDCTGATSKILPDRPTLALGICPWQGLFLYRTEQTYIQTQTYIVAQNRTRTHDPRVRAVEDTTNQGPRSKCNQQFHTIRKMLSTETSVHVRSTRRYIPEDSKFVCFVVALFKLQFRLNFIFWCWKTLATFLKRKKKLRKISNSNNLP